MTTTATANTPATETFSFTKTVEYPVYPVIVDYELSLDDMIKVGRYDVVKDDITAENFPVSGEGQAEKGIVLMPFD